MSRSRSSCAVRSMPSATVQPEVVREVDDRGDQEAALLAVTELADELLVDLEYVDRAWRSQLKDE